METIIIDGFECDLEKVKDAARRCVLTQQRINRFRVEVMTRSSSVDSLIQDIEQILKGEQRSV